MWECKRGCVRVRVREESKCGYDLGQLPGYKQLPGYIAAFWLYCSFLVILHLSN